MTDVTQINPTAAQAMKMVEGYSVEHTGPGTPAGKYLRRFWQPVYHCVDLRPGRAVPLKIMNEDFTLYRSETGTVHLTEARCPHRGTMLHTGWIEGDTLRCFYHGWKFNSQGDCIEQPAEESSFAHLVKLRMRPTREYLGLIFAYFGEGEPPEFPLYPTFEHFDGLVEVDSYLRECNYYQNLENALDTSHVGYVHADNIASFTGFGMGKQLTAQESDWGVSYTFTRPDGRQRVQQFGMPNIFYMTALPTNKEIGWQESLFWWVPIDDERHMQFSLHRVPITGAAATSFKARRDQERTSIDLAHQEVCNQILEGMISLRDVDKSRVDLVRLQDDIAQVGQGRFASWHPEKLGRADVGVAMLRRLIRREIGNLMEGRPLKDWWRTADIVPRVWSLETQGEKKLATTNDASRAEIIDIRPFVEVKWQLKGLHGALSGNR